jgi:hypothetical protein
MLMFGCQSKSKYNRESMFLKYLGDNRDKFGQEEYNILVLRDLKTTCTESYLNYQIDEIVIRVADSLKEEKVFIISDNPYVHLGLKILLKRDNLIFIKEDSKDMIKYGFLLKPTLFKIRQNKISKWKYL